MSCPGPRDAAALIGTQCIDMVLRLRHWIECYPRRSPGASPLRVFVPSWLKSLSMKSYDVIRQAVHEPGVKSVAAALKVSPALVYKWCEAPADNEDPEQSGAKNPLDRVREMYMLTKDIRLIRWLCNEAGGFFISNPVPELRKSLEE